MTTMGKAMVKGRGREERSKYHFSSIHDGRVNFGCGFNGNLRDFSGVAFLFFVSVSATRHPTEYPVAFDKGIPTFYTGHLIKEVRNENT